MAGAVFEVVDAVYGAEVYGVYGEAVEGIGGQGDDFAGVEAFGYVVDEGGLGFVGVDAEKFCGQGVYSPSLIARRVSRGEHGYTGKRDEISTTHYEPHECAREIAAGEL